MGINYHQAAIRQSVLELSDLIRQRRKLDKKIARLQNVIRWAAIQSPEGNSRADISLDETKTQVEPIGFTDAVRLVLSNYRMWLSPVLVRDLLPTVGFDTQRYKDPLLSIHVILRRLVSSGEALRNKLLPDGVVYIWASEKKAAGSASGAGSLTFICERQKS